MDVQQKQKFDLPKDRGLQTAVFYQNVPLRIDRLARLRPYTLPKKSVLSAFPPHLTEPR